MRRSVLPFLILATVLVAAALAWWTLNRGGSGAGEDLTRETRDLPAFRKVEIRGAAEVRLVQGAREGMTVESGPGRGARVHVETAGDTLTLSASDNRRWWQSMFGGSRPAAQPRVVLMFRSLDALGLAGAVKVSADRVETPQLRIVASGGSSVRIDDLQTDNLRLSGSGALKADLAGRATDLAIDISGAGEVQAAKLAATNANVDVSGVGSILLAVDKTLRANISGAGSVEYIGNPTVRENVSGVGRVKRRDAKEAELPLPARGHRLVTI